VKAHWGFEPLVTVPGVRRSRMDEVPRQLDVLFVEDTEDDTILLSRVIRQGGFQVRYHRVETAAEMSAALEGSEWDVVIADYHLPCFSASQALELLKNSGRDLPFIIVSGAVGEEAAVAALRAGAHDFVTKGNPVRLIPAIERELREARQRREHRMAEVTLDRRYRFETLLAEISSRFITLSGDRIDQGIQAALKAIAGFAGGVGVALYQFEGSPPRLTCTHEWNADPAEALSGFFQGVPYARFGYFWSLLERGRAVVIRRLDDLPPDADGERAWYREHGFRPVVLVPVVLQRVIGGVLGVNGRIDSEGEWPQEVDTLLRLAADVFANILDRKRAEQELRIARKAAQAANQAKSRFLANMSHEVRTPMNGVLGLAEILLESDLSDQQREQVKMICRSGTALLNIINDILDLSKVESGRIQLEAIPFDLEAVLESVEELLVPSAQEKGIELSLSIPPNMPRRFIGDPGRIRQIVTNLVNNAVKFTERGSVAIAVEPEAECQDDRMFRIVVRDTGIGIPADKLEGVCGFFSQGDVSTTRKYGGTGLGLAISRQLAHLMGGAVGAVSEVGKGSTFWLSLTLPIDVQGERGICPAENLDGVRVLVLADEGPRRATLAGKLAGWDMRVEHAPSPSDALAQLCRAREAGDPFRAVVLDSDAAGPSVLDLGRGISIDDGIGPTALVLLASIGIKGDARQLTAAGYSAYLVRPFDDDDLREVLVTAISAQSHQDRRGLITRHSLAEMRRSAAHVLVAGGRSVHRQAAEGMLRHLGCAVTIVDDEREAARRIEAEHFDLVLLDCLMPEMDGFAAAAEIRRLEGGEHPLPIIALTDVVESAARERCRAAGMDDVLPTPITRQALADMLGRWYRKAA